MFLLKILAIIAFIMYLLAPSVYSYSFCACSMAVFIIIFFILIKKDKKEKVGFNLLFSISFFSCNYLYPVFVYPIFPSFSIFAYQINENVISSSTALVTLAYAMYALGYYNYLRRNRISQDKWDCIDMLSSQQLGIVSFLFLLFFLLFVSTGGLTSFSKMYESHEAVGGLFSMTYFLFYSFAMFAVVINMDMKNKLLTLILIIAMLLLLLTGTRTLPILVGSVLFCRYCYMKNVSYKNILLMLLCGFVLLSLVGRFRGVGSGTMEDSDIGYLGAAEDFIVNSRNMYDIYDHVNKDGINYGKSSLSYILAVIPFAQGIVSKVFNIPIYEMRSESLVTYWTLGEDSSLGLGTNVVGDVYLSFGLLGVILLFYFLGYIVMKSRIRGYNGNPYYMIVYYTLVSGAIFMCRGSYFYSLKNIVWSIMLAYLFKSIHAHKPKNYKLLPQ